MAISTIGVQQILPRSGTGWQGSNPSPGKGNDGDVDGAAAPGKRRPPPEPGTGKIVDRIA